MSALEKEERDQPPGKLVGKLAGLSLSRQVLALALWPFFQNLMSVGVGFVDMIIAGRMEDGISGEAILDMVGASMYLMWLLMILQGAMGTGAMALVSRSTGARDMKSANLALGQALLLGLISGIISAALILILVPHFAWIFGLTEQATSYLISYMRMSAWLAPFSGVLFVCSSCLRAWGDTMRPFFAMFIVNIVNVIASLYFVYQLDWGVSGLAIGSVIGWGIGAVIIILFLRPQFTRQKKSGNDETLVLSLKNLRYDLPMMRRILNISWPNFIEILGMWSVHAIGVYFIGAMKGGVIGAHAMVVRLESISFMPGFAIGMAASTLTGQYLGAQNPDMARKAIRFCWCVALIAMGGTGLLTAIFNHEILLLFSDPSEPQFQIAAPVIRFVGLTQILTATMMVMKMSMRGAGDTRTVTRYSFLSMGLIRVLVLGLIMKFYPLGLLGIWIILSADTLVQAVLFTWLHYRGKWAEKEV